MTGENCTDQTSVGEIGPHQCALALAIPLSADELGADFQSAQKEFARSVVAGALGATSGLGAWNRGYAQLAERAKVVLEEVRSLGVTVVERATLADLGRLFASFRVVTILAHGPFPLLSKDDIIDEEALFDAFRQDGGRSQPQHRVIERLCQQGDVRNARSVSQLVETLNGSIAKTRDYYFAEPTTTPGVDILAALEAQKPDPGLTRMDLYEAITGAVAPPPIIELADGIHDFDSFCGMIPESFSGSLELLVCSALWFSDALRRRRPLCGDIVSPKQRARIGPRMDLYKAVIRLVAKGPINYSDAALMVHRAAVAWVKERAIEAPDPTLDIALGGDPGAERPHHEIVQAPKIANQTPVPREACVLELATPDPDEVECTVFAPPRVERGSSALVQVFVHLPDQSSAVASLATQFDSDASIRGSTVLAAEIASGTVVMIELAGPGMVVDEPMQKVVWRGRPASVTFETRVPRDFSGTSIIATVRISIDAVPSGNVKFKTTIAEDAAVDASPRSRVGHRCARYRRAFVSYCAKDRDEVLKRVQMLKRLRVHFFQDVLDLEPGNEWEPLIYRHIDDCDVFLLFWSSAAKASEWVRKEFLYALSRKTPQNEDRPELIPVVLEGPPVPAPPAELAHLHFNDQILNFLSTRYSSSA